MNVLGLSGWFHDSAACVVREDGAVFAAQQERFDRIKGSAAFPAEAIASCLQSAGITMLDVHAVVFYEKPFLKLERVLFEQLREFPRSFPAFLRVMPAWLGERLTLPLRLRRELAFEGTTLFLRHHLSHAASAFLVSPFDEAAILTVDGVGEWATATWGVGRGIRMDIREEIAFPDSLGLLYTAVTTWLGFEANLGEGKVMALAGFGDPSGADALRRVVTIGSDGSFRLDPSYVRFSGARTMVSPRFLKRFGPARRPEDPIEPRHRDVAASLQALLEDAMLAMARHIGARTGLGDLCMAGGVALNCAANRRIVEEGPFRRVFIQPAAGDAGAALGAAMFASLSLLGAPRRFVMRDAFLGPEFSDARIRRALATHGQPFETLDPPRRIDRVAGLLAEGRIVGWFQGRMEFGPRALGHRSILADARDPGMKERLNSRVKHREPFRPYGAVVPLDETGRWFERTDDSPFMLVAVRARPEVRDIIPSALHVDGTCRHQTLTPERDGMFHDLVREFGRRTGVPVLINTSFNDRGEPIVCTPDEALASYRAMGLDALVLGNHLVVRGNPEDVS